MKIIFQGFIPRIRKKERKIGRGRERERGGERERERKSCQTILYRGRIVQIFAQTFVRA